MPHRHACLVAAALAALVSGAAPAAPDAAPAYANPTFANPDTPGLLEGKPAADAANVTDIVFLKSLANGGRAEVELGKLAEQRAASREVKEFGGHMVKDHSAANSRLAAVARSAKVELPKELDAEHAGGKEELSRLEGAQFDVAYLAAQIKDHQKAVQLLTYEIAQGQHSGARAYAAETLPTVMQHLETARAAHAKLTGALPKQADR
jgi:putative membrane protein